MKASHIAAGPSPIEQRLLGAISNTLLFCIVASTSLALTINTSFYDAFPSTHLGVVLIAISMFYIFLHPRVLFSREFVIYIALVTYMLVQLLWTVNVGLAMNTIEPSVNFAIVLILFGTFVTFHSVRLVLAGILVGVMTGALIYTVISDFPFVYPPDFSYNAMGLMYFFGLFVSLLLGCYWQSRTFIVAAGLFFASMCVATTSIKTNLGIFLGVVAAIIFYFRVFRRAVVRNWLLLVVLTGILGYTALSNEALVKSLERGVDRVALGIEILQAREDIAGYSGFEERSMWAAEGIKAWKQNSVFGYGVEAFRDRFGTTSHSTPIDLLYNSGLIGCALFYAMFASILWRLYLDHNGNLTSIRAVIFGTLVSFLFMTIAGTMNYHYFTAAFIAISAGLLRRSLLQVTPPRRIRDVITRTGPVIKTFVTRG